MNQIQYKHVGSALRAFREAKRLSQDTVAKAAGIGRSTLVHLENGADVRLAKIAAVASTLGVSLRATAEPAALVERQLARAQMNERNLKLKNAHLRLALDLILEKPAACAALADARGMVELWSRARTCSPFYIDAWRKILQGAAIDVGKALAQMDSQWASALMQNSPFGAVLAGVNDQA